MQIKHKYLLLLFFIAASGMIYHSFYPIPIIEFICKPALMISLGLFFYANTKIQTRFERFILLAISFSFLGDVLLMFQGRSDLFFLLGLAAFLVAHFMYLKGFLCLTSIESGYLKKHKWIILLLILFWLGNVAFYWACLPTAMKVPFICYSFAISLMLLGCIHAYGDVPNNLWRIIFIGAILFVISDSIIGLTKFCAFETGNNGFWIMSTYMISQLLICYGSIKASFYCRFEAQDSISSKF